MARLGDIDVKKKPVEPKLFLCKPNKEIIAKMNESFDIGVSLKLGALNELNFKLPIFLDIHHQLERNINADNIRGRYLVKLTIGSFEEYFIINNIEKVGKKEEYLDVKSFGLGYELNDKTVRDYEAVSKTATELLNDVLVGTIWSVGYVDSEFDLKYRGLQVTSKTSLELVFDIAKTFNALIVWDTFDRKINFYKPDSIGMDRGFKIKYGKYLEGLNQEDSTENIVTRLKMYGSENISIRSINPTGTTYIEDLSYFMYPYSETRNYTTETPLISDIIADWSYVSGEWVDNNGQLELTVNSSGKTTIHNPNAISSKNYKISSTFVATGDDDVFGMMGRYQDSDNYYYIGYESGRTNGGLSWTPDHLRLYKVIDGVETLIASSNGTIVGWSNDVEYKMSVEFNNDLINVWLDNVLVISANDDSLQTGAYGFFGWSQAFKVYDIIIENKEYTVENNSSYMSDELCHYQLEYDRLLQDNKDAFNTLVGQKEAHQSILTTKQDELFSLETQLKILLDDRDILNTRIAQKEDQLDHADNTFSDKTGIQTDLDDLKGQLDAKLLEIQSKEAEISAKENEIIVVEEDITEVENKILELKIRLSLDNNFTPSLLEERTQHIIEREWQDNNIEDPKDLLKEGINVFNELKEQKITLKIDIVNFLSMVSEQRNWDKLNLGDTFGIEYDRLNVLYKAKIIEIDFDFEDDRIDLKISNVKDIYANKDKFLEMLYESYSTSTQVKMDSWEWNLAMENQGSINEIINNKWDANKNAIIGAKDQVVEVSDRGLIIRDPNDPMNYLVGLNSMIAITNDGGQTWKHAITSTGIVGERIYGKVIMGVNLAIEDEHGIVKWQGSKGEIFDRDGTLVMKMGLVEENGACGESFGMISFNDITRVKVTDCEGFVIDRATTDLTTYPDGWEKIFWANPMNGTLYAHDIVTSDIKIVNDRDWAKEILNAETGYFDIGWFKNIVKDNKLTTDEKLQLITELNKIYSGYKTLLDQASKYQRVNRDDTVDTDGAFDTVNQQFPTVASTIDRYSTQPLTDAYIALIEYIKDYVKVTSVSPHDPLTIDINDPMTEQTSEVLPDRATFITKFKTYYDEADKLKNAIEDALYYSGINMGRYYNNILIGDYGFLAIRNDGKYRAYLNATNGLALQKWENNMWVNKVYASIGNSEYEDGTLIAEDLVAKRLRIETKLGGVLLDADALNFDFRVLDSIILDNIIMSPEKITLLNQFRSITEQYNTLKSQISRYVNTIYNDRDSSYYGLDSARSNLSSANTELINTYNALDTYLEPVFVDMNAKTDIVNDLASTREEFHQKFESFYNAYESARNSLEDFLEKSSLQLGRNYNNTVIDAENGITVTRGDIKSRTRMNATDGIAIARNDGSAYSPSWTDVFYVDTDGNLYAEDITTKGLHIVDGDLGDAIIFDAIDGITINGQNGEQIRLNANEGIAIDVNSQPRLWIDTAGRLMAHQLVITEDLTNPPLLDDETGSYISDLTVTSLRSLRQVGTHDHIFINQDYFRLITGDGVTDNVKFELSLSDSASSYPIMKWGAGGGGGNEQMVMQKDADGFKMLYSDYNGNPREISVFSDPTQAINLKMANGGRLTMSSSGVNQVLDSSKIRLEVDASNYLEITSSGVKIVGTRIDLN